jgi:hypothetical protein
VGRKFIIALAVIVVIAVMVGAPLYEIFDIHDTRPFPIDPEFLLTTVGSLLAVCLSVVLLALPCFVLALVLAYVLAFQLSLTAFSRRSGFQDDRLLFSPPRNILSLRI